MPPSTTLATWVAKDGCFDAMGRRKGQRPCSPFWIKFQGRVAPDRDEVGCTSTFRVSLGFHTFLTFTDMGRYYFVLTPFLIA